MPNSHRQVIDKLYLFRSLDKYVTFEKSQQGISQTSQDQQQIINAILDNCCKELIIELEYNEKVAKKILQIILVKHMDSIAVSSVNVENKDFGYQLCYFLATKIGIDLWRHSDTKPWGYWLVNNNEVKTVKRIRKSKK